MLITANAVVKDFSGHRALNHVSMEVPKGSIYGLLGPNGAGKTTLLRIINQITAPDQGSILFEGKPIGQEHRAQIGYLPEERGLYKKMKVGEQALYLAQLKGMSRQEAMKRLKVWFQKFEIGGWWDKKVEELSKGMAQKVQFITTVLHEPKLLIFDEPFSGFDPINVNLLKQEILQMKQQGATIIFSTHNMASVEELCDHITLINKSETILQGEISQIRDTYKANKYLVSFSGDGDKLVRGLNPRFELLQLEENGYGPQATIRIKEGEGTGDLLRNLVELTEIRSFQEILPSMNDIFIQVVGESSEKKQTSEKTKRCGRPRRSHYWERRPVMNKIPLIIMREYLTRIRKKSFIIMSILGPFIFAAYILIPMYFATLEDKEEKNVVVLDESKIFTEYGPGGPRFVIPETEYLKFQVIEGVPLETFKLGFEESGYYAVLFIPSNILNSESSLIYSTKQTSVEVTNYIQGAMENEIEHLKLATHDIADIEKIIAEVETSINLRNIKWTKDGETKESVTEVVMMVGLTGGMLVFFFIFFFGSQVMRGVIEEKVSRIIEVIVSSVKPFQLMMGKIIGVGLTGLTQFLVWIIFSAVLIVGLKAAFFPELNQTPTEQVVASDLFNPGAGQQQEGAQAGSSSDNEDLEIAQDVFASLKSINIGVMLGSFLFYFIFGYLLYAAMFAVIGSAVDNETDTQTLIMPVILPLILGIYVMISAINNPDASLPFWFSMIPFTSPVVMMARIPFGVPWWQMAVSGTLLVGTFLGMTWIAGKVYRTGILMYGKKISYKEIWKWLRYSS